jgi:F-type H+-transporting ATPase subunit b
MSQSPTTSGTTAPAEHGGAAGFPPFRVETFPSQLFWLAITFGFLFVVLWRIVGPRVSGVLAQRKQRITDDLSKAEQHRRDAEQASAAYQSALAGARSRAQAVAEENRKRITADIERAKASAENESQKAIGAAESRIAAMRAEAKQHIERAAQDAAMDIVLRLTGEKISADEAAAAVLAGGR